jgi:hypothetical protein
MAARTPRSARAAELDEVDDGRGKRQVRNMCVRARCTWRRARALGVPGAPGALRTPSERLRTRWDAPDTDASPAACAAPQRRVVDQVNRFNPAPEAEPPAGAGAGGGDGGNKDRGCRCGRTKCLKQYCQCFRNDVRCTSDCVCDDCHNDGRHEEKRIEAIRRIRMNNANAFKGTALEIEDQAVQTPRGTTKMIRGCRCKRSRCQKKYCECYSAGIKCTTNCVCKDCVNGNDGGSIKEVAAITKGHAAGASSRPSPRAAGPAKGHGAHSPRGIKGQAAVLPSQKHQPGPSRQFQTASQRPQPGAGLPPTAAAGSSAASKAPSGTANKKSFRRNDLKVGVPVPTYVPPLAEDGSGAALMSAQPIVTPHGSIHMPAKSTWTRSSPRGISPGMSGLGAFPGPGSASWNSQPSASLWASQPSAGMGTRFSPRLSQNSPAPALMREDSTWGEGSSLQGMLRSDSLLAEQYSPLSGDMRSPTTRSRAGLHTMGGGGMASAGPSGLQRRSSMRSNGGGWAPMSATSNGAAPFADMALSPFMADAGTWGGLVPPEMDPDGILRGV